MARAVLFSTPGQIDIRAFTHFGVNAKPNSQNPIGYFGTGLKYAIAVMCREGLRPVLWIGGVKYTFKAKASKFRDKEFDFVVMIREPINWVEKALDSAKKREIQLPFTTALGKNWELWMAFRELESNTRDEGGETLLIAGPEKVPSPQYYDPTRTLIVVEGEKFVKEGYLRMEEIFLPGGATVQETFDSIQIIDRPSKYVYYRGLRVYDLEHPSELTYNFLGDVELTEDRTAKYPSYLDGQIATYIARLNNAKVVEKVVAAPEKSYEGRRLGSSFKYAYTAPSRTFIDVVTKTPKANEGAKALVEQYEPKAKIEDPFKKHPRPWSLQTNGHFLDRNDMKVPKEMVAMGLRIINNYDYENHTWHKETTSGNQDSGTTELPAL